MCLSTIYNGNETTDDNMLCEYVVEVDINDNNLKVIDITGNMSEYSGSINKIDLVKNQIFINLD